MDHNKAEKIAIACVEAHEGMKFLWGSRFNKQIQKYIDLIMAVARKKGITKTHAMANIITERADPGCLFKYIMMAALTEINEREVDREKEA